MQTMILQLRVAHDSQIQFCRHLELEVHPRQRLQKQIRNRPNQLRLLREVEMVPRMQDRAHKVLVMHSN